jgi:23S rRNA-/tRNA-specific pseudouridylate synthase
MPSPLTFLYDQDGLIALDKPPGLPSTGRDLDDPACLQAALQAALRRPVWAVHQLDRDTSGVHLFVRRKALVEPWARRLHEGQKEYLALCHGAPTWDTTRAEHPLGWLERGRRRGVTPQGQPARTDLTVLARAHAAALLLALPRTGRTHQIRLHLAALHHPLIGEPRYKTPPCALHPRHALHCARIRLGDLCLEAPLPPDLVALAAALDLKIPPSP